MHQTSPWTHNDEDDIVAVIHRTAHPIQLQPVATDNKTFKRFIGRLTSIYIMAVDQWLQFFSHLAFAETRSGYVMRMCKNEMLLQYSFIQNDLSCFTLSCRPREERGRCSLPSADSAHVLYSGLHQFQRQRSLCDPVPSALRVQPHLLSAGAQPQSQVHLWSLLCQEMPTWVRITHVVYIGAP